MEANNTIPEGIEDVFDTTIGTAIFTIHIALITVGIFGNSFIVYILSTHATKTQINISLLHLSLMNIGQQIGVIPYLAVNIKTLPKYDSYTESVICAFTYGLYGLFSCAMASVYCLSVMCIARCLCIKKPLAGYNRKPTMYKILTVCWSFAIIWSIPHFFAWRIERKHGCCIKDWRLINKTFGDIYETLCFIIGLIIPTVIMLITYLIIICDLYSYSDATVDVVRRKHRKKIVIILGGLIAIFFTCWLPYGIYWILLIASYFTYPKDVYKEIRIIRAVLIPSLLAGIFIPLLYGVACSDFRKRARQSITNIITNFKTGRSRKLANKDKIILLNPYPR